MKSAVILFIVLEMFAGWIYTRSDYYYQIERYWSLQKQLNYLKIESKEVAAMQMGGQVTMIWSNQNEATKFLEKLKQNYPNAKIFKGNNL